MRIIPTNLENTLVPRKGFNECIKMMQAQAPDTDSNRQHWRGPPPWNRLSYRYINIATTPIQYRYNSSKPKECWGNSKNMSKKKEMTANAKWRNDDDPQRCTLCLFHPWLPIGSRYIVFTKYTPNYISNKLWLACSAFVNSTLPHYLDADQIRKERGWGGREDIKEVHANQNGYV
jgi:hypothetical protein